MDHVAPEKRSEIMRLVKGKDTKPELVVRQLLHRMGYRYRLHRRDLPGKPDIVFASKKKAIFVHGCFWHRHPGCRWTTMPKTKVEFWERKFESNVTRDSRTLAELKSHGWDVLIVWQCETRDLESLADTLQKFLRNGIEQSEK